MKKQMTSRKTVRKSSEENKKNNETSINNNSNRIMGIGIVFLVLIFLFLLFRTFGQGKKSKFTKEIIPNAVKKIMNNQETAVTVDKLKDVSGVYEFELGIGSGSNARKYTSYITKDGNILFSSGIILKTVAAQTNQSSPKKKSCSDLNKVDKANLTAYVVANCPFGLQMQRVFKKAIGELTDLSTFLKVRYIGSIENGKITSMHGDEEAQENLRQICIREEQSAYYWPYVSCYMQEQGKSADCLAQSGVNIDEVNNCMSDAGRGLKFAQADFDLANKYNIGSSPTLLLNDTQTVSEFDFGGRTANTIKDVLCCGEKSKSEFCSKELSKTEVASSFSKTDEAATSGSSAANCGQ